MSETSPLSQNEWYGFGPAHKNLKIQLQPQKSQKQKTNLKPTDEWNQSLESKWVIACCPTLFNTFGHAHKNLKKQKINLKPTNYEWNQSSKSKSVTGFCFVLFLSTFLASLISQKMI